jgi:hypothetical protein
LASVDAIHSGGPRRLLFPICQGISEVVILSEPDPPMLGSLKILEDMLDSFKSNNEDNNNTDEDGNKTQEFLSTWS